MATLIPEISISEFKKLKADQLRRLKSCEVMADGSYLFTFVNSQTDFIRIRSEYLCQTSNSVSGKSIEEVVREEVNQYVSTV